MLHISRASVTDIPIIRDLTYKVWPQTYESILSKEQIDYMLDLMYSETSLLKQFNECSFIIVYNNQEPVGFASYQNTTTGIYKLHKLYVLPSQQGNGTGRFILGYIINDILEKGGNVLQLQVNRYNKAKSFYEKSGFKIIEEADFDIGNGYYMNDYVMEKIIQ